MPTLKHTHKIIAIKISILFFFISSQTYAISKVFFQKDSLPNKHYKGKVIDAKTKKPLIFATLTVKNTNISTVTNSKGKFLLKVPQNITNKKVIISFLGYTSKILELKKFKTKKNTIKLETYIEELPEINVVVKDAKELVKEVFERKKQNYHNNKLSVTTFYRETIKKRRTYVSVAEAVVEVYKQAYTNNKKDLMRLLKSRKSTNYKRLDTIALKLKGGPFNTLALDVIKNPTSLFTKQMFLNYNFKYGKKTKINNNPIQVVLFEQKPKIKEPLFYGKLFIDTRTLALYRAKFQLNLKNKEKAAKIFILKKPRKVKVLPTKANYLVNYRNKNGKWYFGYSRIELGFNVKWAKKWFSSNYYSTIEMAVTDWKSIPPKNKIPYRQKLKHSIIMSDETSGFSDSDFWGKYNVIEPEKPIENAIKKISRQLRRMRKN